VVVLKMYKVMKVDMLAIVFCKCVKEMKQYVVTETADMFV